jgi:hypothetical protein
MLARKAPTTPIKNDSQTVTTAQPAEMEQKLARFRNDKFFLVVMKRAILD